MELEASNLATRIATVIGCGLHHSPRDFKLRADGVVNAKVEASQPRAVRVALLRNQ